MTSNTLYDQAPTLASLAYMVASELKSIREGTTTTASISAPVDSLRSEAANYWQYGPFWVLYANAGSAPTGEYQNVSSFQGGTVTLAATLSATIPSGSRYAIGRRRFPLDVIVQNINSAYQELGDIPLVDDTSLSTTSNTTEYTIPQAARNKLLQVWLQTETTYTNVHGYIQIPHGQWRQETATLYLPQLSSDADTIKLVYADQPSMLVAYGDQLSPYVHPKLIVYKAAANVLMWRAERINDTASANAINQRVNYFLDLDQKAKYSHPIHMPKRQDFGALANMEFTGGRDGARVNVSPGFVNLD